MLLMFLIALFNPMFDYTLADTSAHRFPFEFDQSFACKIHS